MYIHSIVKRKVPLFFLSLVCVLIVSGVNAARLAAEEQPAVTYFTDTDTGFSGQATVYKDSAEGVKTLASKLPILDSTFSSITEDDGSMRISIFLHNTGKELSAQVDNEGDIVRMQSFDFAGELTVFDESDRDQLKLLARALNPTFNDLTPARERFATFANFIIGQFPSDVPLDIHFIKKPTKPSQICWELNVLTTSLLGTTFVGWIRDHQLDKWLKARKWVYDSQTDSLCGLKYTPICNSIGLRYTNAAGFVTTRPLNSLADVAANIAEKPHQTLYHENMDPMGVPVTNNFCAGRCGPGCFGNYDNFLNSSYFTLTAECFAHDECIGEVGYSSAIPTGGNGNACIDEFINASWGYVNGLPCNTISKTDVLDWWAIGGEFLFLSKQATANGYALQQIQGTNQLVPIGVYLLNTNTAKQRYLTAIKYSGTNSTWIGWFYSGMLNTPTKISSGLFTNNNTDIVTLRADKSNLNGNVYDAQTGKPLSGVAITITGDNLDQTTQTSTTDSRGSFLFLKVSPYDTYTVQLSLTGYRDLSATAQVSMYNTPLRYNMDENSAPVPPVDISFELFTGDTPTTWSFTQNGTTSPVTWTAERIYYSNIDSSEQAPYGKVVWNGNSFTYNFTGHSPNMGDTPIITDFTFDGGFWQSYNISIQGTIDNAHNLTSASITMDVERIYSYPQPPTSWASQGNTYHAQCTLSNIPGNAGTYDWKIPQANASALVSGLQASFADVYPYDNGTATFINADWANANNFVGELQLFTVDGTGKTASGNPPSVSGLLRNR